MNKKMLEKRYKYYENRLNLYLKAEEAILNGAQSYRIGTRQLFRGDLHEIRMVIPQLQNELDAIEAEMNGGSRRKCVRVIPRDI